MAGNGGGKARRRGSQISPESDRLLPVRYSAVTSQNFHLPHKKLPSFQFGVWISKELVKVQAKTMDYNFVVYGMIQRIQSVL